MEAGRSGVQCHPRINTKFKATLGHRLKMRELSYLYETGLGVSFLFSVLLLVCSLALLVFCPGKNWGNSHSNKQVGMGRIETAWLSSLTPRKSVWWVLIESQRRVQLWQRWPAQYHIQGGFRDGFCRIIW